MEILPYIIRRRRCRSDCNDNDDMPPFGVILTKTPRRRNKGVFYNVDSSFLIKWNANLEKKM